MTCTELGEIMLNTAGEAACLEGYGTLDPFWIGYFALEYGDINEDGELN